MLKRLTILYIILFVLSSGVAASAIEPGLPALIITEIVADNASSDAYEYIEILNASGKTVNLYDYSIAYVADLTSASYNGPNKKTAIVPGNFSTSLVDRSRAFDNPSELLLLPGDLVLIWFWSFDSYAANAKLSDFRAYYELSGDVRIIAIDADNSTATGNPDRFNLQNSGYRGICVVQDEFKLNAGYDEVICMAPLDYGKIQPSMPDLSVLYGKPAKAEEPWRLTMTAYWVEPTPGYLAEAQQIEFAGAPTNTDSAAPTSDSMPASVWILLMLPVAFVSAHRYKRLIRR